MDLHAHETEHKMVDRFVVKKSFHVFSVGSFRPFKLSENLWPPCILAKTVKIITKGQELQAKGTDRQAKSHVNKDDHMQIQTLSATITAADVQLPRLVVTREYGDEPSGSVKCGEFLD